VTARRFMRANRRRRVVRETVGLFGASRGAYRRRAKRGVFGRRGETGAELIREIVLKRRRRRGIPRAGEASRRDRGEGVGRKKAAALMRRRGLNARGRRKLVRAAGSRHSPPQYPVPAVPRGGGRREMGVGHRVSARHGPAGVPDGGSGHVWPEGHRPGLKRRHGRRPWRWRSPTGEPGRA
jgi:hypothetical protein